MSIDELATCTILDKIGQWGLWNRKQDLALYWPWVIWITLPRLLTFLNMQVDKPLSKRSHETKEQKEENNNNWNDHFHTTDISVFNSLCPLHPVPNFHNAYIMGLYWQALITSDHARPPWPAEHSSLEHSSANRNRVAGLWWFWQVKMKGVDADLKLLLL